MEQITNEDLFSNFPQVNLCTCDVFDNLLRYLPHPDASTTRNRFFQQLHIRQMPPDRISLVPDGIAGRIGRI